jgi:PAS domain S-box-containing protein
MEMPTDWHPDGEMASVVGEDGAEVQELQQLVDAKVDGVVVIDDEATVRFVDEAIQSRLNADEEAVLDSPVEALLATEAVAEEAFDVTSPTDLQRAVATDGEADLDVPLKTADGSVLPATVTVVPLDDAGLVCLVHATGETGQSTDEETTDEQPTGATDDGEEPFREYRAVVQTVADPIYVLDKAGNIRQVNDAMVEYTGYEREELLDRSVDELIPAREYDSVAETLRTATQAGETRTLETTLVTSEGGLLLTEARITALTDEDGDYAGSVGILRDIRDRKERERDLELLKEVLTRVFRHNIRNELMIIQGHAEAATADDLERHREEILDTTQRVLDHSEKARLIEAVIETDELHDVDLTESVETVIERCRHTYPEASLDVNVPEETAVVAHPDIESAIEELVENAIIHADEEPAIELWTENHERFHTLYVRDESGGLDDTELDVLRDGAESRFEHSSGVGLWLVRWLVEYSGATLLVHRTAEGTLMGIRFHAATGSDGERTWTGTTSPVARVPARVRELDYLSGGSVVGRTEELHELENHYDATMRTGGHAIFVTGDVGVGKSTLVEEFQSRLTASEESPLIARGHCLPDVTAPYHVVRQVFDALPVDADGRSMLADVTRGIDDDPETVQDRRQALFADIAAKIRSIATEQPVVLILEDIHWADRTTVDLLEYLLEEVGRWALPVLFVGTYRRGVVDSDHPLAPVLAHVDERGREQLLELEPLDADDVALLLADILAVEELPEAFVERVHDHTGGSPLFVSAIGQHIAEHLETAADLPAEPSAVALPDSVESILTDRLAALDPSARKVIELGAVVGDRVALDVLLAASRLPTAELLETVDALVEDGLWSRRNGEVRFVHGLVREQTLAAIGEEREAELHGRVAAAIESVHEDAIENHYGQLAHHYHEAGALDSALDYYELAGDQSMELYANERALDQYRTGRQLAREIGDEEALFTLTANVTKVSLIVGAHDRVDDHISFLREHAEGAKRRQRVALLETKAARRRGEFDAAIEAARAGVKVDPTASELHCRLLGQKGVVERQQGKYEQARETARAQLDMATQIDNTELEGDGYRRLGVIAKNKGNYEQAARHQEQALERFQAVGDRKNIANVHTHLGVIADMQGVYEEAIHHYQQAREMFDEMSHRQNRAYVQTNLGAVAMERGKYDRADEAFTDALRTFEALGDIHARGTSRLNLGELTHERGEFNRAREYYQDALEDLEEVGDRHTRAMVHDGLAMTTMTQGDYERATREAEAARSVYDDIGNDTDIARVLTTLGKVARRQGEHERARDVLEDAMSAFESVGDDHRIATPRLELARLDRREGSLGQAETRVERAMETARETKDDSLAAECRVELARLARERGSTEAARDHLETALELFRRMGDIHGVATVRLQQGQLAREEAEHETARTRFEHALDVFAEHDAFEDAFRTLDGLVETCRALDDEQAAREWCQQAKELLADTPEELGERHGDWIARHGDELDD